MHLAFANKKLFPKIVAHVNRINNANVTLGISYYLDAKDVSVDFS